MLHTPIFVWKCPPLPLPLAKPSSRNCKINLQCCTAYFSLIAGERERKNIYNFFYCAYLKQCFSKIIIAMCNVFMRVSEIEQILNLRGNLLQIIIFEISFSFYIFSLKIGSTIYIQHPISWWTIEHSLICKDWFYL